MAKLLDPEFVQTKDGPLLFDWDAYVAEMTDAIENAKTADERADLEAEMANVMMRDAEPLEFHTSPNAQTV